MDLDALAGSIAAKHAGEGVTVVTAACDRINIENPLKEICDLEYSGQGMIMLSVTSHRLSCSLHEFLANRIRIVTYASGRSSMEVTCKVAKAPAEGQKSSADDILMSCQFTMVALDPQTRK
jgi:acyl-coenzyme A thioesterase 9